MIKTIVGNNGVTVHNAAASWPLTKTEEQVRIVAALVDV
jgi:hypothetical protein